MLRTAALSALAACLLATSTAQAHGLKAQERQRVEKQYYHAAGVVRWIGHHARVTQYHPDPRIKHKWQAAAHYWVSVRQRAWLRLHPKPVLPAYPPHHSLWTCIGSSEGAATSVNPNGHYGMLQMTYGWLGYISGRASDYPQSVQEWAAERAYAASGYSRDFLDGQWLRWDGRYDCLIYA